MNTNFQLLPDDVSGRTTRKHARTLVEVSIEGNRLLKADIRSLGYLISNIV